MVSTCNLDYIQEINGRWLLIFARIPNYGLTKQFYKPMIDIKMS